MKIKDLIKELEKLDGEKTIGVVWEDCISINECEMEIRSKEKFNKDRDENLKLFDYYV